MPAIVSSTSKPAAFTIGPSSHTAIELSADRHRQPHAGHARAHAVVDVAHDHRVGERDRAEDRHHEEHLRAYSHQPCACAASASSGTCSDDPPGTGASADTRSISGRPPAAPARPPCRRRRAAAPAAPDRRDRREALGQQLVVAVGGEVESRLPLVAASVMTRKTRASSAGGSSTCVALRLRFGRRLGLARRQATRTRMPQPMLTSPGIDERHAPAQVLHQEAGDHRGQRDAEVAGEAVHADRPARRARVPAPASGCPPGGRSRRRRRAAPARPRSARRACVSRHQQRRRAHAEEEHQHHRAPAPRVAQLARRGASPGRT